MYQVIAKKWKEYTVESITRANFKTLVEAEAYQTMLYKGNHQDDLDTEIILQG